jgi:hypothetical protein
MEFDDVDASADPAEADVEARVRKRALKRQLEASQPLDPWEQYRALNDAMDEAYELIDIGNREARFALILLGGLNAIILLAATRAEITAWLSADERLVGIALIGGYAALAVFLTMEAIKALSPQRFRPQLEQWAHDDENYPMGVRYYEDVITRDVQRYWSAWQEVRIGQINAELAVQVHSLCLKNQVKKQALVRLYGGLKALTLMVLALAALLAYAAWN